MQCKAEELKKFSKSIFSCISKESFTVMEDVYREMVNNGEPFNFESLETLARAIQDEEVFDARMKRRLVLAWIKENEPNLFNQLPEPVQKRAMHTENQVGMKSIWL